MTSSISREALLKVAQLVRPAVSNQAFIPALTHIQLADGYATAYNDVTAISVSLGSMVTGDELDYCLPGDLLIKVLSGFTTSEVTFKTGGKEKAVTVSSGRSNIKLHPLAASEFPLDWPAKSAPHIVIDDNLLRGIERCLISVGNDPTHPAQMGVTIEVGPKGNAVLYATDNFTISRFSSTTSVKLPADSPIILPTFFCEQLLVLAKSFPDDQIHLLLHDSAFVAEIGEKATLFTKIMVDASPLQFEKMLRNYFDPAKITNTATPVPSGLDAALARALLILSNSKDKFTKISCKGEVLQLSSSSDLGEADDDLAIDADDAKEFVVDPTMIARVLKLCDHMTMLDNALVLSSADGAFVNLVSHCSA